MKRNDYRDEIPFFCSTCREGFAIEGYVVDGLWQGVEAVIPANGGMYVFCPNDIGEEHTYTTGKTVRIPTHRTNRKA